MKTSPEASPSLAPETGADEHSCVRGRPANDAIAGDVVAERIAAHEQDGGRAADEHEAALERTVRLALIEHQHLDRDDPRAPLLRLAIVRRDETLLKQLLVCLRGRIRRGPG